MIIEQLIEDLKLDESFRAKPYQDINGIWTTGYGWNLESTPLSEAAGLFILREHVLEAFADAERYQFFHSLTPNRKRVIANMIFNLGRVGFRRFKKTIKYLDRGDYESASIEMLDSLWAKQVGQRAIKLSELMKHG